MTPITTFIGQRVALFGLGGSGLATARALVAGGAIVSAFDDSEASRARAAGEGVSIVDLAEADFADFAALVVAPGVPLTHPEPHWSVTKAAAAGIPVIGDIELFLRERRAHATGAPLVAITGTNGKSTTTALIAHLLTLAGRNVQLGGNIGTAVLSLAPPHPDRVHVLEISSFQIDLSPSLDPTIGVLLNLSPDHLDRHGTMDNYAAVKERLIAGASMAVIGVDDDWCAAIAGRHEAENRATIRISTEIELPRGLYARGSRILFARNGASHVVADLAGIGALRGRHNAQNVCAAIAAVSLLGVDAEVIEIGLRSFPGLPHRMEQVGRVGRVLFVNDSKATNADSTEKALASFDGGIHWLLGGRAKAGGIAALEPYFSRIAGAYLFGEATDEFARTLDGRVRVQRCDTIAKALAAAALDASLSVADEPVVLLSPAAASYDQFRNFEERGDVFRGLVRGLPQFQPIERGS
jgi:UDP-N-acetylmuramoylalanine--D-glutamate ligase